MSKKLTVMTILGTRPEIIRLSRIIFALDKNTNHIIVHTGQNYDYELNKVFFDDLRIRTPDYFLDSANHNKWLSKNNWKYNIFRRQNNRKSKTRCITCIRRY